MKRSHSLFRLPHRLLVATLLLAIVAAACSSSDDDGAGADSSTTVGEASSTTSGDAPTTTADSGGSTTTAGDTTTTAASGPATGQPIPIGITHVDTEALASRGLDIRQGDYAATYQAIIDHINENGGIHGRPLEATIVPFDPAGTEGSEAACIQLAEDVESVLITGRFLGEQAMCPLETYGVAMATGNITDDLLARAQAPWITTFPDTDGPETVIREMAERGLFDGTVGVYASNVEQDLLDSVVTPTLDDVGVEPAETGIMDAPQGDTPAIQQSVQTIAERFEASGVDTVLVVGNTGENYLSTMAGDSYRPTLLFLDQSAANAFTGSSATADTSILEGAVAAGPFGPDQARFEESAMQECVGIVRDAGVEVASPDETAGDDNDQRFQAVFRACPDMYLVRAWLDAAGPDITNDTLQAAIDTGFEVNVPGDPEPRTYGPPPDLDGDPAAFLYAWNEADGGFELLDG